MGVRRVVPGVTGRAGSVHVGPDRCVGSGSTSQDPLFLHVARLACEEITCGLFR